MIIKGETESCRIVVENPAGDITYSTHDFSDHHGEHHDIYAVSWKVSVDGTQKSRFTVC